jgi:hypothetical protein
LISSNEVFARGFGVEFEQRALRYAAGCAVDVALRQTRRRV